MASNSSRPNAFGRQIRSASSFAAVSSVAHNSRASSGWVFSRVATARSWVRFTPWSSPCLALTSRNLGSSSSASSAITAATDVPSMAVWAIPVSCPLLRVRPGILHAAVQSQGLLLHHRRDRAVARALLVPVAEGVTDLVVDHVQPVGRDVSRVVGDGGLPAGEVDDGALAVAAGGVAAGAHAGAVRLHVARADQRDPEVVLVGLGLGDADALEGHPATVPPRARVAQGGLDRRGELRAVHPDAVLDLDHEPLQR